jgi:hypothetical protein
MQLWKVGNEQLLLVGTSLTGSNSITTAGEAERYMSFGHDVIICSTHHKHWSQRRSLYGFCDLQLNMACNAEEPPFGIFLYSV